MKYRFVKANTASRLHSKLIKYDKMNKNGLIVNNSFVLANLTKILKGDQALKNVYSTLNVTSQKVRTDHSMSTHAWP